MRVGVTGHQDLSPGCADLVRQRIGLELDLLGTDVIGYSSLAAGTDQLFAEMVLERDGQLTAVLPSERYETSFTDPAALRRFEVLLCRAHEAVRLPFPEPSEAAYWRAGQTIVDRCDLLLAIWDGEPARGLGGTADVVRYARGQGRTSKVIWPDGCSRLSN